MEKEEMYQRQQRRLLEGEKLKHRTWLLQHEQRQKLIQQQVLHRKQAFKQQQMQAKSMMRQLRKVESVRKHANVGQVAQAGRLGLDSPRSNSPLAMYARDMTRAGLGVPPARVS